MKKITQSELKNILSAHKLWHETNGKQGERASLVGSDLEGANLQYAKLTGANIDGACLHGTKLYNANLTGTILDPSRINNPAGSSFSEELQKLLDKYGLKLAGPIPILHK